jgi:hypothetical protein
MSVIDILDVIVVFGSPAPFKMTLALRRIDDVIVHVPAAKLTVPPPPAATLSIAACIFPPGATDTVKPGGEYVFFEQAKADSMQKAVIIEIIDLFIIEYGLHFV